MQRHKLFVRRTLRLFRRTLRLFHRTSHFDHRLLQLLNAGRHTLVDNYASRFACQKLLDLALKV